MARILGVDFGLKRTGLAVTDPLQNIVNGLDTVETARVLDYLRNYLSQESVEQIVVGYPFLDETWGDPTFRNALDNFIKCLREAYPDIQITLQDERFTSSRAREIILQSGRKKSSRRAKALVARTSAVLILQEYPGHI